MGEDITMTTALFQMLQRVETKLDDVKDDLNSVKSKQAVIESTLQDHIDNTSEQSKPLQLDQAKAFIFKYIIPIALSLIMIGRASVDIVGNSNKHLPVKQDSAKVVKDDAYIIRNERFDSIIKQQIKKGL